MILVVLLLVRLCWLLVWVILMVMLTMVVTNYTGDVDVLHIGLLQGRLLGLKEQWKEHR